MPLEIVKPRNARTKNLYIRGSYLGVAVDRTSGTDRRSVARGVLKRIEQAIERGDWQRDPDPAPAPVTFAAAAANYLRARKTPRYVAALVRYFRDTPIGAIDQAAIDTAAATLHPHVSNATRNVYVYTPVSAILHHAGIARAIARPPGAKGRIITNWLNEADAFGIVAAADAIDFEFGTLLAFLLYTGPRINGALNLTRADLQLARSLAWARPQKRQAHHAVRLNADLCRRFATLLKRQDRAGAARERMFRWHYGGQLKFLLIRATLAYLSLDCPVRRPNKWRAPAHRLHWVTFHSFRHTWATWMRQHAGADVKGLVATGNWRDERSAARYAHAAPSAEWARVDLLPTPRARSAAPARQKPKPAP